MSAGLTGGVGGTALLVGLPRRLLLALVGRNEVEEEVLVFEFLARTGGLIEEDLFVELLHEIDGLSPALDELDLHEDIDDFFGDKAVGIGAELVSAVLALDVLLDEPGLVPVGDVEVLDLLDLGGEVVVELVEVGGGVEQGFVLARSGRDGDAHGGGRNVPEEAKLGHELVALLAGLRPRRGARQEALQRGDGVLAREDVAELSMPDSCNRSSP